MSADICPSDLPNLQETRLPGYIRADGGVSARFAVGHRGTRIADLTERGGFRFRFPAKESGTCEAVLINTGGGMTGGDRLKLDIHADCGADVVVTTQAAEKIYRSLGQATELDTALTLDEGSALDWLPQETILFSDARVERRLDVIMAADARLIAAESVVFGRTAMGETMARGAFRDRWRIRRAGELIFAEDVKLDGALHDILQRRAIADGARAAATVLMVARGVENRLDAMRAMLAGTQSECAAASWNDMMLVRFLSKDAARMRIDLAACLSFLRDAPLPRVWQC